MKKIFLTISLSLAVVIAITIAAFSSLGDFKFSSVLQIINYDNYISNLIKYNDTESPSTPDKLPIINGFEPIVQKYFDYAKPFNGNLTYASRSTQKYLLNREGKLFKTINDLSAQQLIYDKFVFTDSSSGMYGIKDIYGRTLIAPKFSSYQIIDDTILMRLNNIAYIYVNSKFISSSSFNKQIDLYDSSTIIKDNTLYDIEFKPLTYLNYRVLSPYVEDMCIITSDDNLLGYISKDENIFIEPQFTKANNFVNGYAVVSINDRSILINKSGEIVYEKENLVLKNFYDGYICYSVNGKLGVMNNRFETVVAPEFIKISMDRAYGNFLIDEIAEPKFYSIKNNQYDNREFKSINPYNGYYICQNLDNTYSLLDNSLNTLIENCELITFSKNILMVKSSTKYYFYRCIEQL